MAEFNDRTPDARGVRYGCVVAISRTGGRAVLRPLRALVSRRAGDNDGLVPTSSQRWGHVYAVIETDHWGEIGWSEGFDAPAFYERLVRKLRRAGC
jgi:hypothetical protein